MTKSRFPGGCLKTVIWLTSWIHQSDVALFKEGYLEEIADQPKKVDLFSYPVSSRLQDFKHSFCIAAL